MELVGEVGSRHFCTSGTGEGNLHCVEVSRCPRNGEVHGVKLVDDSLQILDRNTPLVIGYFHKGY